jgi:hypothetical protein
VLLVLNYIQKKTKSNPQTNIFRNDGKKLEKQGFIFFYGRNPETPK